MKTKTYSTLSRTERLVSGALGTVIALGIVSTTLAGFVVSTHEPEMPLVRVEPVVITAAKPV